MNDHVDGVLQSTTQMNRIQSTSKTLSTKRNTLSKEVKLEKLEQRIGKDSFISKKENHSTKSDNGYHELISKNNEEPAPKLSSIAKKIIISRNGEQSLLGQPVKKINGKRSSNSQDQETFKKSKITTLQNSSDIIQNFLHFINQSVLSYSTLLQMNGGLEKQELEKVVNCGVCTPLIFKNLSTNGGMDTTIKK